MDLIENFVSHVAYARLSVEEKKLVIFKLQKRLIALLVLFDLTNF